MTIGDVAPKPSMLIIDPATSSPSLSKSPSPSPAPEFISSSPLTNNPLTPSKMQEDGVSNSHNIVNNHQHFQYSTSSDFGINPPSNLSINHHDISAATVVAPASSSTTDPNTERFKEDNNGSFSKGIPHTGLSNDNFSNSLPMWTALEKSTPTTLDVNSNPILNNQINSPYNNISSKSQMDSTTVPSSISSINSKDNSSHLLGLSIADLNQDYHPSYTSSPIADWTLFFKSLEKELIFPIPTINETYISPVSDACLLICGCIVSEKVAKSSFLNPNASFPHKVCLICQFQPTDIFKPIPTLRNLYFKIAHMKQLIGLSLLSQPPVQPSIYQNNIFPSMNPSSIQSPTSQYSSTLFPNSFNISSAPNTSINSESTNVDLASLLADVCIYIILIPFFL